MDTGGSSTAFFVPGITGRAQCLDNYEEDDPCIIDRIVGADVDDCASVAGSLALSSITGASCIERNTERSLSQRSLRNHVSAIQGMLEAHEADRKEKMRKKELEKRKKRAPSRHGRNRATGVAQGNQYRQKSIGQQ